MRSRCATAVASRASESLARERVVNRTVDGDVQQDVDTERDVGAATPGLTVSHQLAAEARSEARQPLLPEAASHQVVVGDIPAEPPGFRPRTGLLAELDRAGARVSVIHAMTGRHGPRRYAAGGRIRAGEAGCRLAAGGLGQRRGRRIACRRDWLRWLRPRD